MRELNALEVEEVAGGIPVVVALVGYVAVRHFGGIAIRAAVGGFATYMLQNCGGG